MTGTREFKTAGTPEQTVTGTIQPVADICFIAALSDAGFLSKDRYRRSMAEFLLIEGFAFSGNIQV